MVVYLKSWRGILSVDFHDMDPYRGYRWICACRGNLHIKFPANFLRTLPRYCTEYKIPVFFSRKCSCICASVLEYCTLKRSRQIISTGTMVPFFIYLKIRKLLLQVLVDTYRGSTVDPQRIHIVDPRYGSTRT